MQRNKIWKFKKANVKFRDIFDLVNVLRLVYIFEKLLLRRTKCRF